jgi:large subunit ribosomal protein L17
MRHRKSGVKLNRTSSHRKAMFRNMVTSLFKYERIRTTDTKAKEVRRWADNLITLAKRGDLQARRQAMAIIREKAVVHKLFEEAPKRFGDVAGGYTRVVKIGFRSGDAAPMSLVELVTPDGQKAKKKRLKAAATSAVTPAVTLPAAKTADETSPADSVIKEETAPQAQAVEEVISERLPDEASDDQPDAATDDIAQDDSEVSAEAETAGVEPEVEAEDTEEEPAKQEKTPEE